MITMTPTARENFSRAVSRYASVRKRSFLYASLRGCRSALYSAIGFLPRGNRALILALDRSYKWRSWVLTRVALGRITGIKLARGRYGLWKRSDAKRNALKLVRVRASRLGWRVAFLVRAIQWVTSQLRPFNASTPQRPVRDTPRQRRLNAIRNRSYMRASQVSVLCEYTLRNALTSAGQNTSTSTAHLNETFADALARGLAVATADMQAFCDAHTARNAPRNA